MGETTPKRGMAEDGGVVAGDAVCFWRSHCGRSERTRGFFVMGEEREDGGFLNPPSKALKDLDRSDRSDDTPSVNVFIKETSVFLGKTSPTNYFLEMEEKGEANDSVVTNMEVVENENIIIEEKVEETHEEREVDMEQQFHEKEFNRVDSLDKDANRVSGMYSATKAVSLATVLQLAFQSIGVVYGDIGTSPLYVFASTFTDRIPKKEEITGALSLIIYSLTLFPLIKYVFIVLWANDYGDGGTFAIYSLICRHSKVSAIPNQQLDDTELSTYKMKIPNKHLWRAEKIKEALEKSTFAKTCLLSIALLGTCMVIGDGILTPCISVLSAVDGVRKIDASVSKDVVVMISVAILVALFSIQRFGTDKKSFIGRCSQLPF
ncbi:Potassium transporter 19 [Acorus calamus]|uniref:Potassium transporter 19 n=1 Tax=Acorus calamus TaxID=4465 RepID=A0AAV9EXS7_ACOCL|nr:Potassium transporter 19 [Acorus calamus]